MPCQLPGADLYSRAALPEFSESVSAAHTCTCCLAQPPAGLFLPASAWKAVRRAAADQLLELQQQHTYADGLANTPVLPQLLAAAAEPHSSNNSQPNTTLRSSSRSSDQGAHQKQVGGSGVQQGTGPRLRVLCRTPDQVSAALAVPWLDEVIVDFLEVHGLKEAVGAVQAAGKQVRGW